MNIIIFWGNISGKGSSIVTSKKNENIEDQDHKPNRKSSRRRKESSGNEISIGDPYKNLLLNNRERKH